jgi:hypothetical protein
MLILGAPPGTECVQKNPDGSRTESVKAGQNAVTGQLEPLLFFSSHFATNYTKKIRVFEVVKSRKCTCNYIQPPFDPISNIVFYMPLYI